MKKFAAILLLLAACVTANAQFYVWGVDNGTLKWHQIETEHYRIVYPADCDSLAREYARTLEKYHDPVGVDLGYSATQMLKKKMPVILHTGSSSSNGMVVWAPKRMELISTPDLSDPVSTPWREHLVLHESRHVAQMQFTHDRGWKVGRYFLGDLMSGAASGIVTDPSLLEGDAVVAETALTGTGRGRNAAFLEYYHAAYDQGDMRNFWRWRYGSNKLYTPDYYRAGYLRIAGARVLADDPMVVRDYISKPFVAGNRLKKMFDHVSDSLRQEWAFADSLRGPFPKIDTISGKFRRFTTNYLGADLDGWHYSVRAGLERIPELIRTDRDGNVERLSGFSSSTGELRTDPRRHRIVWTEIVGDARWSFESYAVIRYREPDGKTYTLKKNTKYFDVYCSSTENEYAALCYPGDGSCSIVVLDSGSGDILREYRAPAGLEYTSVFYLGDDIYAAGITDEGASIYNVSAGNVRMMAPTLSTITEADVCGENIQFISDRTGVSELYTLNPKTGEIRQRSLTKFGGYRWVFEGDSLLFNSVGADGYYLSKVPSVDLPVDNLDYSFNSFLSRTVTEQEDSLRTLEKCDLDPFISEPAKYSKFGHLFRFHSWAPVYIDYDEIESLSFSNLNSVVQPGAMAFFQNDLSTSTGYAGVGFDVNDSWSPYAHLNYKYSGLYPVFELKADIGKSQSGTAKVYIPWSKSTGGVTLGCIPQLSFGISSTSIKIGEETYLNDRLTASLRGYAMSSTAPSAIFPRFGIGAEAGVSTLLSLTDKVRSNAFFFLYGYIPGIVRSHGIKLTGLTQFHIGNGKYCTPYASIAPRGFTSAEVLTAICGYPVQTKLTVDYAMPLFNVDWTWMCPVAYIKNFELTPHFDYTYFTAGGTNSGSLNSVGADFNVCLGNLLWIPYTTRIGVSYSYCGGNYFNTLAENNISVSRNYFGLIFSIDL